MYVRTGHLHDGMLALVLAAGGLLCKCALAEELSAGTVLDSGNIEGLMESTFEGHRVSDLLVGSQRLLISQYGMKVELSSSRPIVVSPDIVDATERYSGEVRLDPQTRKVAGFTAGVAFPRIEPDDPDIALKLIWNQFYLAPALGDVQEVSDITAFTIGANDGVRRTQSLRGQQLRMEGRFSGGPATLGNGLVHKMQVDYFTAPRDIAGTGVFQIKYNDGRVDDVFAYVKTARRIRRLSGGTWMDPTGALDFLNDDSFLFNSYPLWHQGYRYLGKRWMLAVVHQPAILGSDSSQRLDFENPPHWNNKGLKFEPRGVHVIEVITPDAHPYLKKVLYMEADPYFPHFYFGEYYDRKGELWRVHQSHFGEKEMADGKPGFYIAGFSVVDVQREQATALDLVPDGYVLNRPGVVPEDFRPEILKEAAEGRLAPN